MITQKSIQSLGVNYTIETMLYPITILLSAAIAFGAAWQVQSWRFDAKEKEHETQRIAQLDAQRLADTVQLKRLGDVQKAAETRALALRHSADSAHRESVSLRGALVTLSRQPATDATASTDRANAVGALLADCSDKYQTLGAVADRHASDVQTLSEAWETK